MATPEMTYVHMGVVSLFQQERQSRKLGGSCVSEDKDLSVHAVFLSVSPPPWLLNRW